MFQYTRHRRLIRAAYVLVRALRRCSSQKRDKDLTAAGGIRCSCRLTNVTTTTFMTFRHIKEHLDGVADLPDNMTQEELEFHYFK